MSCCPAHNVPKVKELNRLHKEVQEYKAAHPESKLGYYENSIGSLLNAYREGDVGFNECVALLERCPRRVVGEE